MTQKSNDKRREVQRAIPDQTWAVFGEPLGAWEARGLTVEAGSSLNAALAASLAATALLACEGIDQLLETATDLARNVIGLERAAFYLREPDPRRVLLRGRSDAGNGEITAERGLLHELSPEQVLSLQSLRPSGGCALYRSQAPWFNVEGARGNRWVMVTPLFSGNDLIGVLYNDAVLDCGAVDPSQQAAAAVLANVVSLEYAARCGAGPWGVAYSAAEPGKLAERIRNALDKDLARRGNELATQFGVSPGHLARVFKREMGVSLVEYRNRKRLDRFLEAVQRAGGAHSLKHAAVEAGFGSYAQFSRVHKKFLAGKPRRDDARSSTAPGEVAAHQDAAPRAAERFPAVRARAVPFRASRRTAYSRRSS